MTHPHRRVSGVPQTPRPALSSQAALLHPTERTQGPEQASGHRQAGQDAAGGGDGPTEARGREHAEHQAGLGCSGEAPHQA